MQRDWGLRWDMTGDGAFTISDVYLLLISLFFYPGDVVVYALLGSSVGNFFEMTAASYGGGFSFLVSILFWLVVFLIVSSSLSTWSAQIEARESGIRQGAKAIYRGLGEAGREVKVVQIDSLGVSIQLPDGSALRVKLSDLEAPEEQEAVSLWERKPMKILVWSLLFPLSYFRVMASGWPGVVYSLVSAYWVAYVYVTVGLWRAVLTAIPLVVVAAFWSERIVSRREKEA